MTLYTSLLHKAQLGRALFETLICSINIYPIKLIFGQKLHRSLIYNFVVEIFQNSNSQTSFFGRRIKNMVFIFNKNIITC